MIDFLRYQHLFSEFLQKNAFSKYPHNLYDPADYILSLGGKRIRPVFALMGCDLYSQKAEDALHVAMAVEVFHNFTLIHDDIMDQSDIRRGHPTVHKKYNTNVAILSGDLMLIKAFEFLTHKNYSNTCITLIKEFNKMAIEVCEGQQLDVDFETRNDVKIEEYIEMITLKTSVLIACALKMGAIVGGAPESDIHHLFEFAKNYGIAFQLQDDYLDTFGNRAEVGKRIGGDILNNKKTYLYLKAMELSDEKDQNTLLKLYTNASGISDDEKISLVTEIFRRTYVEEYSKQLLEVYRDLAYSHLNMCQISETHKSQLIDQMNILLFRKF